MGWPDLDENTHCDYSERVNCMGWGEQLEAIAGVQAKGGGALDEGSCMRGRGKYLNAGYILMTGPMRFADEVYVGSERKKAHSRVILVFRPKQLTKRRKRKCRMVERNQEFFLDV